MNPDNSDVNNTPSADAPTPDVPVTPAVDATPAPVDASVAPAASETPVTPVTPEAPTPVATSQSPFAATDSQTPGNSLGGTPPVTPTNPTQQGATPFTAGTPPVEPPKQSNTKKIILIAAIAGGAILLAVIGFVVFLLLTTVSKEDYAKAATAFNEVSRANSDLTSDVTTLSYSTSANVDDGEFEEGLSETEASIEKIKTENEELSKLKAVKVGEGAKLYDAFDKKLEAYLGYGSGLVTSVKNLRPALLKCGGVSDASDAAGRIAAMKTCSTALGEVNDIPNEQFKTFVSSLKDSYAEYATVYEKISALSNPYGSQYEQYKTLRDQMYAVQDKISDASSTFSDAMDAEDEKYSVKPEADALAKFLTESQR